MLRYAENLDQGGANIEELSDATYQNFMAFHPGQNSSFDFKVLDLYFTLQLQYSILFFSTQHVSIKLQIRYIDFKNSCFALHIRVSDLPFKFHIRHYCFRRSLQV